MCEDDQRAGCTFESHSILAGALSSHASKSFDSIQPNTAIRFPYSRHSSYYELCALVDAFKPKDIFPCTVDGNRWDPALGMSYLFGSFCSDDIFRHDAEMMKAYEAKLEQESAKRDRESQQETQTTETDLPSPVPAKRSKIEDETTVKPAELEESAKLLTPVKQRVQGRPVLPSANNVEVPTSSPVQSPSATTTSKEEEASRETERRRAANRKMAYDAALGIRLTWADYGGLVSTRRKQDVEEFEQEL